MKIAISAESTIDLSKELIEKFNINIIPFNIQLGDKGGLDGEITTDEIISFVNKTGILPKTSAVNEYQFNEYFTKLHKEYDAIIHFSLSSELSATCNNAKNAAKNFKNVFIVDTKSLSTGIALLAIHARELVDEGLSAKDVYEKCVNRVEKVQASFELKRLDYMHKGGRCSGLTLFAANLLKIRPQILLKDGKMIPGKKYKGNFAHVVKNYCQDVLEQFNTPDLSKAFITCTTADAEIVDIARAMLKEKGFKNIYETRAGATITSHCGEDCLGILYINDAK